MFKKIVLKLLGFYKKYLSIGEKCRFIPSCSEYTYQAVDKYGIVKGLFFGMKRIGRCNRWHKGGIDLLK
jgi:hypothetical protein